jgi:hypothetical protein
MKMLPATTAALSLALASAPALAQMGMDHRHHGMPAAGAAHAMPPDTRQPVLLSATERTMALAEMRVFLESVNGVLDGVVRNDAAAVASAAAKSGMRAMQNDPTMMQMMMKMPPELRTLGRAAHQGFDELADAAAGGRLPADALARLATITGQCVACHATFRFEAQ